MVLALVPVHQRQTIGVRNMILSGQMQIGDFRRGAGDTVLQEMSRLQEGRLRANRAVTEPTGLTETFRALCGLRAHRAGVALEPVLSANATVAAKIPFEM